MEGIMLISIDPGYESSTYYGKKYGNPWMWTLIQSPKIYLEVKEIKNLPKCI